MPFMAVIKDDPTTGIAKRFLTELDVEARYGIAVKTLRNWRLFGRGPVYRKFGTSVRYSVADVEAWISSLPRGGAGIPSSQLKTQRK